MLDKKRKTHDLKILRGCFEFLGHMVDLSQNWTRIDVHVKYSEFPPTHYKHNIHCVDPAYKYGKAYYKNNYHKRNEQIAKYSDKVVAFCPDGKISSGTKSALKYCEEHKKKYIIIK